MVIKNIENRLFYCGLTASLLTHVTVIWYLSLPNLGVKIFQRPLRQIEVTYHAIKKKPDAQSQKADVKNVKVIQPPPPPQDVKVLSKESDAFSSMARDIKDMAKLSGQWESSTRKTHNIKTLDFGRKITVPLLKADKITNPKYLNYTQDIRHKIKQKAYSYVDHPDFEAGEVYLTFVLASNGILRNVKIISERTSANVYLQQIGMRSIEESAPFSPFPSDLQYPELTFNVIISFELTP
ncbi:MAG: hypothetical protein A3G91_05070 [Omnitrophica WOR_2 bacterium RIFCSPLOWO2_12_FULL_50_9]|nr:MAG: hypothetical protein A3D87_00660 [Omnitrophica WOR_2 bacterium RIFCSPHIGHO2_02_FULL_50_17]OGX42290.1 MAG: hypothetical protein A3G91_05070 [Omnitrophica WOR_2 bacterium RIFCSPLOWO2_12_FULL_50_9]